MRWPSACACAVAEQRCSTLDTELCRVRHPSRCIPQAGEDLGRSDAPCARPRMPPHRAPGSLDVTPAQDAAGSRTHVFDTGDRSQVPPGQRQPRPRTQLDGLAGYARVHGDADPRRTPRSPSRSPQPKANNRTSALAGPCPKSARGACRCRTSPDPPTTPPAVDPHRRARRAHSPRRPALWPWPGDHLPARRSPRLRRAPALSLDDLVLAGATAPTKPETALATPTP